MSQGRVPLSQTESAKDSGHSLAKNTALMHAIRDERTRRVRNGVAAQEAACKYFIKAPKILDEIMTNEHHAIKLRQSQGIKANGNRQRK